MVRGRTVLAIALLLCAISVAVARQERPVFEVASIKPQKRPLPAALPELASAFPTARSGGTYAGTHASVDALIKFAYRRETFEIADGPDWIRRDYFDVTARASGDVGRETLRLMVRSLLEDRFKLVVHTERRKMDALTLVLSRDDRQTGPYLQGSGTASKRRWRPARSFRLVRGWRVLRGCRECAWKAAK